MQLLVQILQIYIFKKKSIVPLYSKDGILKTKKFKDFNDWSFVVDIYYFGYHLLPEGKLLNTEIKIVGIILDFLLII